MAILNLYTWLDKSDVFAESDTCLTWKLFLIIFAIIILLILYIRAGQNKINNEVKEIQKEIEDENHS